MTGFSVAEILNDSEHKFSHVSGMPILPKATLVYKHNNDDILRVMGKSANVLPTGIIQRYPMTRQYPMIPQFPVTFNGSQLQTNHDLCSQMWLNNYRRAPLFHRFIEHSHQPYIFPGFRKPKRIRTAFSPSQLMRLEDSFDKNHYVVGQERKKLAASLNLSETQVKVWFQNRRTKYKRGKSEDDENEGVNIDLEESTDDNDHKDNSLDGSVKDERLAGNSRHDLSLYIDKIQNMIDSRTNEDSNNAQQLALNFSLT